MQALKDTLIGGAGVTAITATPELIQHVDFSQPNVVQVVIQIIVAVATLLKLFKKSKPVTP